MLLDDCRSCRAMLQFASGHAQPHERIARRRERHVPLIQIEEARLPRHAIPPRHNIWQRITLNPQPLAFFEVSNCARQIMSPRVSVVARTVLRALRAASDSRRPLPDHSAWAAPARRRSSLSNLTTILQIIATAGSRARHWRLLGESPSLECIESIY
jgi:hypothetical protein